MGFLTGGGRACPVAKNIADGLDQGIGAKTARDSDEQIGWLASVRPMATHIRRRDGSDRLGFAHRGSAHRRAKPGFVRHVQGLLDGVVLEAFEFFKRDGFGDFDLIVRKRRAAKQIGVEFEGVPDFVGQDLRDEGGAFDRCRGTAPDAQAIKGVEDGACIAFGRALKRHVFGNARDAQSVAGIVFCTKGKTKCNDEGLRPRHGFENDANAVVKRVNFRRGARHEHLKEKYSRMENRNAGTTPPRSPDGEIYAMPPLTASAKREAVRRKT